MGRSTERAATFVWYGPFILLGRPGEAPEKRLTEFAGYPGEATGLYLMVGALRRAFWSTETVLYVGQTARSLRDRLKEHLDPAADGAQAKLCRIEREGRVACLMLGVQQSPPALSGDGRSELDAYENLLIHALAPPLNKRDAGAPGEPRVMINRFDTALWAARRRPRWRPTMIPDIIDFRPADARAGEAPFQLIWTGTRGVALQRRECGPGGLYRARRAPPRPGLPPSL